MATMATAAAQFTQEHSASEFEEKACRFCGYSLPALWKPDAALNAAEEQRNLAPVMQIRYNGPNGTSREFKMRVRPGPEGLALFKAHLKEVLGIDIGPEFDVSFQCQMPYTGSTVTLSGLNAYGAATQCAAVLAATKCSAASTSAPSSKLHEQQLQPPHPSAALPAPLPSRTVRSGRRSCQTGYLAPLTTPRLVSGTDLEAHAASLARPAANSQRASSAGHPPPTRFRAAVTGFYAAPPLSNPESLFLELGLGPGATSPAAPLPGAVSATQQDDHLQLHAPQQQRDGAAAASSSISSVPPSLAASRRSSTEQHAPSSASCASEASMGPRSSVSSARSAASDRSSAAFSSRPQPSALSAVQLAESKQPDASRTAAAPRRLRLPEVARRTMDSLMRALRPEKKGR
ncbi:hypothetical protein TSOC_001424 [Tetrabaena socialis]|uniref:Uncharacterized protein n=1 Tax=Tetrabaena socialis TaxID=47790 RepID=A0A2J8AGV0_9CHLO|nr:hypothetical protein TSOC_001424 [Tetrabaena socialis]|eukprot:PNH11742.1 hypothetical protein TSOC_001424 [Tetrabaena socialis]